MDKDSKMTVIIVEPGLRPYLKDIPPGLKSLRREVGGKIEATFLENGVYAISDEFAKLTVKPLNRSLRDGTGKVFDIIAGTFLLVGVEGEHYTSLPQKLMEKYISLLETEEY